MLKYRNREYGFEGRPPYFKEFTEESDLSDDFDEGVFPKKTKAGFGLDPKCPEGMFFGGRLGTSWCVVLEIKKKGKYVPIPDLSERKAEEFSIASGARYLYVPMQCGTFVYSAVQQNAAVFSFQPKKKTKVRLLVRPQGASYATVQSERDLVKGRSFQRGVLSGQIELTDDGVKIRNRFTVTRDDGEKKDYFALKSYDVPDGNNVTAKAVFYEYDAIPAKSLLFYASIGEKAEALDVPSKSEAEELLSAASSEFSKYDESGTGVAAGRLRALREIRKNLCYDPYLMSEVLSQDKRKEDGYFGYDGAERGLGAIIAAAAGEYEAAETMALCAAGDAIFGALSVFLVYRHTKNKSFLKSALPRVMEIWDASDKLIVADPKTKRELSYRQTGSPLKDDLFRKGAAYSVDMSSYKLLSFRLIQIMLEELGVDAADYREKIETLKKNLNELLYRKELGVYMNRHLTGEWAVGYGFTSFLPMLAGAAADAETLNDLYLTLKNPKKFWDGALFPTLSKDNYYYGRKNTGENGEKAAKYENYSGMISPWANFLMYAAFRVTGMSELSFALAASSSKLFEREYLLKGEYPSFYRPDLRRSTSEQKHSLSALVMPILGSLELLDYDYAEEGAIRFGVTEEGDHSVKGTMLNGKRFDYIKSDASASLYADGAEVFRGEPGNFEIRGFNERDGSIDFCFRSSKSCKLTLRTPFFSEGSVRKIAFRLESGKYKVNVKDGKVRVQTIAL